MEPFKFVCIDPRTSRFLILVLGLNWVYIEYMCLVCSILMLGI